MFYRVSVLNSQDGDIVKLSDKFQLINLCLLLRANKKKRNVTRIKEGSGVVSREMLKAKNVIYARTVIHIIAAQK